MAMEYEIKETLMSVNDGASEWNLELNLISWNRRAPKLDLRKWSPDHENMSKGLTLTENEAIMLFQEAGDVLKKLGMESPEIEETDDSIDEKLPFE